jgi:ribonucleotide reductase alpha subunit
MTGVSYRRSAELAGIVGAYEGYPRNADAHKRVMRNHQAANDALRTVDAMDGDIRKRATAAWADVIKIGEANGYRNAQASVLAPTGTIGFMMDCDTTGIEPDFSLVKFKKLVGGGSLQIVNQTIPKALKKLGYADETAEAIMTGRAKPSLMHEPGLKPEHYEVRHGNGAAGDQADGPCPHDGGSSAFLSGRSRRRSICPSRQQWRTSLRFTCRAGSLVSRHWLSIATTARWVSPSATAKPGGRMTISRSLPRLRLWRKWSIVRPASDYPSRDRAVLRRFQWAGPRAT